MPVEHYHLLRFICKTSPYSVNPFIAIPDSYEDKSLSLIKGRPHSDKAWEVSRWLGFKSSVSPKTYF